MDGRRVVTMFAVLAFGFLAAGCKESSSSGATGPEPGTYAGTWRGNVCGRGLTMSIAQSGLALSGDYALTDPDFGEAMSGTVTSGTPPASAVLNAGGDRRFEIDFDSYDSFTGGFFKGSARVCEVRAVK